jgi:hypothetical protein
LTNGKALTENSLFHLLSAHQCFFFWRNFTIFPQVNWEKLGIFFFPSVNLSNFSILLWNFAKISIWKKKKKKTLILTPSSEKLNTTNWEMFHIFHDDMHDCHNYLTQRSVLSLNNLQNNEMKICEKYEVNMLKIIIIIS